MIVAGIIIFAVGAKLAIKGSSVVGPLALCGGVALYLAGQAGFAWRMVASRERARGACALVLFALCPFAHGLAGWVAAAIVAAVLGTLALAEARLPSR